MKNSNQSGSVHTIIIGVLVAALLVTLGVVFYQNFVAKKSVNTAPNSSQPSETQGTNTVRLAFQSDIYALDYPTGWSEVTTPAEDGSSLVVLMNPDKSIRIKMDVSGKSLGGMCDANSPRKVRFYNVYPQGTTKLNGSTAYIVETMTDAEQSGYNYAIGLTQDGGDTHASLGDSFCTVSFVGVASRLVTSNGAITSPTIILSIDFPKLANGDDLRIKEMQQVKDIIATEDYKAAIKVLESARKE